MLTPPDFAETFAVGPKTMTPSANSGMLPSIRTLDGHRRYRGAGGSRVGRAGTPKTASRLTSGPR